MRSFEFRRVLRRIDLMLSIVALCALRPAVAQLSPGADEADPLGRLADKVLEAQAAGGPYTPELIEPLTQLSLLYQERGDYAREAATLEQALQVTRANYGLRSLEQVPLMRQRIRNEESIGNFADAWVLEQALLGLADRHPDDLRTAPIFEEVGDKRMELLETFRGGERPPQIYLGCYFDPGGLIPGQDEARKCNSGQRHVAARGILMDAQRNYLRAVEVLYEQQQFASNELHQLEDKLVHSSFGNRVYGVGRRSLQRLIQYDTANSEPLLRRIDRLVQLADWDLAYGQHALALDLYAELYAFLQKAGIDSARVDGYFSPMVPAVVPTFVPNLLSPERAEGATGHVDLEFDIMKFGTTRRIDIVSSTDNVSRTDERRIARWIVENRFRPHVSAGDIPKATRVAARYYVHD